MEDHTISTTLLMYKDKKYRGYVTPIYDYANLVIVPKPSWICIDCVQESCMVILDFSKNKEDGIKYIKGENSLNDLQTDTYLLYQEYQDGLWVLKETTEFLDKNPNDFVSHDTVGPLSKCTWYFVPTEVLIKYFTKDTTEIDKTNDVIFELSHHKALWQWLSENPDKGVHKWPEWKYNSGSVEYVDCNCCACDYAIRVMHHTGDPKDAFTSKRCKHCPFGDFSQGSCLGGLYDKWIQEQHPTKRSKLAKQIRNFPIRKDMEVLTNLTTDN